MNGKEKLVAKMRPPRDIEPKPTFAGGGEKAPKKVPLYFYPSAKRTGGTRWT